MLFKVKKTNVSQICECFFSVVFTLEEILQTANKEFQIEKNLFDLQHQWQEMKFQIQKYSRPNFVGQDRMSIIGSVDEILQSVDDSTLLLSGEKNDFHH